jgi:uncharacterized protein
MAFDRTTQCVAFIGTSLLASGCLDEVAMAAKTAFDANNSTNPLVFDAISSARIDLDLGGSAASVLGRLPMAAALPIRGPGRPKLGVVPREVTLLPRHWDWLATQPGGASVALRKLVEMARKSGCEADERREGTNAIYKFIAAICGDFMGYEEAMRALFAGDRQNFIRSAESWPIDVQSHLMRLVDAAFGAEKPDVQ